MTFNCQCQKSQLAHVCIDIAIMIGLVHVWLTVCIGFGVFTVLFCVQRLNDPELPVSEDMYEAALRDISEHIVVAGNTLSDYNLPQPPAAGPRENRMLLQERHAYDMQHMTATLARCPDLNADQRLVFDTVRASLDAYQQGTLMQVKCGIWILV